MPGYFSYFPKLIFTFDKNSLNQQAVTNIFARSTFLKDIANNTSVYFEYQVKESDTPEIIADKIYGDSFRAWIILLFNNIINPNYDFPMKSEILDSYIENKYKQTITAAKDTIHHYEKELTNTVLKNDLVLYTDIVTHTITANGFNFTTGTLSPETLPTNADTSVLITTEETVLTGGYVHKSVIRNKSVSNYTYEFNENEKRRAIKLLDPAYVQRVEDEFRNLMRN